MNLRTRRPSFPVMGPIVRLAVLALAVAVSPAAAGVREQVDEGRAHFRAGRYAEARTAFLRALAVPALPGDARARVALAAATASRKAGDAKGADRLIAYARAQAGLGEGTRERIRRAEGQPPPVAIAAPVPQPAAPAAPAAPAPVVAVVPPAPAPALAAAIAAPGAPAPPDSEPDAALPPAAAGGARFLRADDNALQTATAVYRRAAGGPEIHLVGMIHIGTAPYYEAVKDDLKFVDAVLTEGLTGSAEAAANWHLPFHRGRQWHTGSDLPPLQDSAGHKLIDQWDGIEPAAPKFVLCDMSYGELEAVELARYGTRTTVQHMVHGNLFSQLPAPLRSLADLKHWGLYFGERAPPPGVFARIKRGFLSLFDRRPPQDVRDYLVLTARNDRVMDMLETYLARPRTYRVAVMYGAAHMPDFDARLRARGYRRAGVRWNTVWSF